MVDSQTPDPSLFWCPECSGHTDYSETKEYHHTSEGGHTSVTLRCKACDTEGKIPKKVRESIRLYVKCLFGLGIGFEVVAVGFGINEGFNSGVLITIFSTPFMCLFFWRLGKDEVILWKKWEKWAKERGWEDVEEDS